ncbi:metallophosphatase [Spirulina subsalsa FACHB-351]|uniref:Metallophosphatase n=1 Tax=Spirulina subsalsa FACHB-351 TaxID=234711 RepID=A0ABT3LAP0_9CYAN|nr:metallophosphatase [Spirulina subsalsa]MCW6038050.1 metallophosphatase [Spirulina subsalsa FACHB-351]
MWAILSGIEGNLTAYEAVLRDLKRQSVEIEALYILGDILGLQGPVEALLERLQSPQGGERTPQICAGFWEDQYLQMQGWGGGQPEAALSQYGSNVLMELEKRVPRSCLDWLRSLPFGFLELDCLLVHGSSVSVSDELSPQTPPWQLLDYLVRVEANFLFCGRLGQCFSVQLQNSQISSQVTTLDQPLIEQKATSSPRQIIGVGSVGRVSGLARYTLFYPTTGQIRCRTVEYAPNP